MTSQNPTGIDPGKLTGVVTKREIENREELGIPSLVSSEVESDEENP